MLLDVDDDNLDDDNATTATQKIMTKEIIMTSARLLEDRNE
jgi:hypothetical protein